MTTTITRRPGTGANTPISVDISTVEKTPRMFRGKTVELEGIPKRVAEHGGKIVFELVDSPGTRKSPLIVSVNPEKVSAKSFRVAREQMVYKERVSVTGVISIVEGEASLAATALEKVA